MSRKVLLLILPLLLLPSIVVFQSKAARARNEWATIVIAGNIAHVETSTGSGTANLTTSSGVFVACEALNETMLPEGKPSDLAYPHGFFSFNITGIGSGSSVTISIALPSDMAVDSEYWKYGPTPSNHTAHWYQIPLGHNNGDNIIAINITDGGIGDDDLTMNARICDEGGPGQPRLRISSQWIHNPPIIDGAIGSEEWPVSPQIEFTAGGGYPASYVLPTSIYFMNDARNLYVLVDAVGDNTSGIGDECLLVFDCNSNPLDGYRVARVVQNNTSPIMWTQSNSGFVAAIGFGGVPPHKIYEFCIPFAFLGCGPGDPLDFCSPFFKTSYAGSAPFDSSNGRDNIWPLDLGFSSGWMSSIGGWGILTSADRMPWVGGDVFPVVGMELLTPYVVMILLTATALAVAVRRRRSLRG